MKHYAVIIHFSVVVFLLLAGGGCTASLQTKSPAVAVAMVDDFHLYAQITVRRERAQRFYIDWQRRGSRDDIKLQSPFGGTHARLIHDADGVVWEADGRRLSGEDGAELSQKLLGYVLPVESFGYWVVGQAYPDSPSDIFYNADGSLAGITQDGWTINYHEKNAMLLPIRIVLSGDETTVEVTIKRWLSP